MVGGEEEKRGGRKKGGREGGRKEVLRKSTVQGRLGGSFG